MACSKPVLQGQFPVQCQFCEVDPKIKWKCVDCDLLLCTKCKDKIHSKVKTAEEHRIINIKEVGKQSDQDTVKSMSKDLVGKSSDQDTVKSMSKDLVGKSSDQDTVKSMSKDLVGKSSDQDTVKSANKGLVNLELSVVQEYSTKFEIDYIQASLDDSLWIGSGGAKKKTIFSFKSSRHLQKVKLERDNLKIISSFNVDVYQIAITPSNDLILADETTKLKQILHNSNKVTESNCCVEPYIASCVHVTMDYKVVVGAYLEEEGAVYVMDINGGHQKIYRHDNNNKPLFTFPFRITSTRTGTLCVIDVLSCDTLEGRLVTLGQGKVISVYTGHSKIKSSGNQFTPTGVISTSNDNIIVTDTLNYSLHVLNNTGSFLTYYNTRKIGIQFPYSLAFNTAGQFNFLYVGCALGDGNGKLYKLTLSGC